MAQKYYGSSKFWTTLWNNNPWIEDPRIINTGWEIKLAVKPDAEEKLSEKLAKIYEEVTAPDPSPSIEPAQTTVAGASTQAQGAPGSFDEVYKQAGSKYGVPWEILYGLHIMETGGRDGAISSGYGTGAQGPLQFMPGTWTAYGVDGDGNGNADINNAVDAIHGAANYIARHGGVEQGLKSYGGDTQAALNHARSRGWGG
ncbi:MAG: lytic transglycosylase domain-containing protein [Candidatus Levybacteria bacterium]|nr:lytic transglycosylase domain-containing protein [Candidatus Levybacteria bacterium]